MNKRYTGRRTNLPLFLTAKEVAALLNVHENTVYLKGDSLPRIVVGKGKGATVRYDRDALFYMARRGLLPDNLKFEGVNPSKLLVLNTQRREEEVHV